MASGLSMHNCGLTQGNVCWWVLFAQLAWTSHCHQLGNSAPDMSLTSCVDDVKNNLKKDKCKKPSIERCGCHLKSKYGFSAPPAFCRQDRQEGKHEITVEEMNQLRQDTMYFSTCAPEIQKHPEVSNEVGSLYEGCAPAAAIADENNSVGMQSKSNWILYKGKMPLEWRAFITLKKSPCEEEML